jgi:hypothetical protein
MKFLLLWICSYKLQNYNYFFHYSPVVWRCCVSLEAPVLGGSASDMSVITSCTLIIKQFTFKYQANQEVSKSLGGMLQSRLIEQSRLICVESRQSADTERIGVRYMVGWSFIPWIILSRIWVTSLFAMVIQFNALFDTARDYILEVTDARII